MSVFSEKLRTAIDECGVPVADLARMSDMSASMLYKIQSGSRLPDGVETLLHMLDAMRCALPLRNDLIQAYRAERIGLTRYNYFQDFKGMLGDMAGYRTVIAERGGSYSDDFPQSIRGTANVNAVIRVLLEQESLRPDGLIDLQVPFENTFCLSYLSQVLLDCAPDFGRVRHIFSLKATGNEEAVAFNMRAIRTVFPRLVRMRHYEPFYCYLPEPDEGTSMFPWSIITASGVLLMTADFQNGIYLRDPGTCAMFREQFEHKLLNFRPLMRGGQGGFRETLRSYSAIMARLKKPPTPVVLAAQPCVLPCFPLSTMTKYVPRAVLEDPEAQALVGRFYNDSGSLGHVTFYTTDGIRHLLETGEIMEIQGNGIPRFSQEDVLSALEEMLRRARQGLITLRVFRENVFQGESMLSMALYDERTLFVGCEMPARNAVFMDMNEATLCTVFKEYTDSALLLGDVHSPEESIRITEDELRRFRSRPRP